MRVRANRMPDSWWRSTRACIARSMLVAIAMAGCLAARADTCGFRGDLDARYCDEDRDLLADPPRDRKQLKNPDLLLFTYAPLDDSSVYVDAFNSFMQYLATCTQKRVRLYTVNSSAAAIEAMRSGRMHVGTFSTGDTVFAVNQAGAIPFAVRGNSNGPENYQFVTIVKATSGWQALSDLRGRRVAHVSPSSNSGNLAPRALLPARGIRPDADYKVLYSGRHENSVTGVVHGDYDAAHVASGVVMRMIDAGQIARTDLRVLFTSPSFPAGSLAMAHDLAPSLKERIRACNFGYRFSDEMTSAFPGNDRWLEIDYKRDWQEIRRIAAGAGQPAR